jgi:putative membrane protein
MSTAWHQLLALPATREKRGWPAYVAILAVGALLWRLSATRPASVPPWLPWDFSPSFYMAAALTLFWFGRGLALTPAGERPALWRTVAFLLGVAAIWAVLQTRFEYWSQHMFFLNRIQHVVMHHVGPFLVALGGAGGVVRRGMPPRLRQIADSAPAAIALRIVQQPVLAAVLFVGLFCFWLVPAVHFRAMIDPRLYALMNWSMVLDGILFWCLVLDPRPRPPARLSYGVRAALALGVMFPQIALGAVVTFSRTDLYPYYDLCGRLFATVSPLNDQHVGGIVIWIPPAMMSVIGLLLVVNALRLHEEATTETSDGAAALAKLASSWTGR